MSKYCIGADPVALQSVAPSRQSFLRITRHKTAGFHERPGIVVLLGAHFSWAGVCHGTRLGSSTHNFKLLVVLLMQVVVSHSLRSDLERISWSLHLREALNVSQIRQFQLVAKRVTGTSVAKIDWRVSQSSLSAGHKPLSQAAGSNGCRPHYIKARGGGRGEYKCGSIRRRVQVRGRNEAGAVATALARNTLQRTVNFLPRCSV